jgi:hypothetical protein
MGIDITRTSMPTPSPSRLELDWREVLGCVVDVFVALDTIETSPLASVGAFDAALFRGGIVGGVWKLCISHRGCVEV